MADDDLDGYGPEEENTVELEQQNHPSDTGEDNIIVIKEWCMSCILYYNQNYSSFIENGFVRFL